MRTNVWRPNSETCDECSNNPADKILWMDEHRHYWCRRCWPYRTKYRYNWLFRKWVPAIRPMVSNGIIDPKTGVPRMVPMLPHEY